MRIGQIDTASEVMLIAEIGNNHEGDFELAKKMISLAAEAGAQAVKFQTIQPERLVHPSQTQRITQLNKYAFSRSQFEQLAQRAADEGVMFLSTPFSLEAVEWLNDLVPAFKISSGDNNFLPLISKVAQTGKPVIMSTGMSDLAVVGQACSVIADDWPHVGQSPEIALLHCVSSYPTPPEGAHLAAMDILKSMCSVVGYSDHTIGTEVAVASVAAGARIIEKHFTIDKNYSDFRDHQLSADPADLKALSEGIKQVSQWLGRREKMILVHEEDTAAAARRSVVLRAELKKGEKITQDHLDWLRPGDGISPDQTDKVIGTAAKSDLAAGTVLSWDMLGA